MQTLKYVPIYKFVQSKNIRSYPPPLHRRIAKAVGGELKFFDKYQGPHIVIAIDVRRGIPPYSFAVAGVGVIRLWIDGEEGMARIYREDTNEANDPFFWDEYEVAVELAKKLLSRGSG